jgi:hypothetical protein
MGGQSCSIDMKVPDMLWEGEERPRKHRPLGIMNKVVSVEKAGSKNCTESFIWIMFWSGLHEFISKCNHKRVANNG